MESSHVISRAPSSKLPPLYSNRKNAIMKTPKMLQELVLCTMQCNAISSQYTKKYAFLPIQTSNRHSSSKQAAFLRIHQLDRARLPTTRTHQLIKRTLAGVLEVRIVLNHRPIICHQRMRRVRRVKMLGFVAQRPKGVHARGQNGRCALSDVRGDLA